MITELKRVIDQVSREKGVEQDVLIKTLEEAVRTAARRKFGPDYDIEVNFNSEAGEIEVFEFKEVVEKVTNEHLQISLEEARKIDPESQVGDELGIKVDTDEFGRIAAQSAKQVIMQRLREAERNIVFDDFKDRKGEIVHGIVQRFDKGSIIVNLGRAEAELPLKEQIPKESYKQGDRIRAYILEVKQFSRGPQVILSRTHPNFLSALFEGEVPEIAEGIVRIVQVAREPGSRAKIAVTSRDSDVDPVGACVGMKGSRVQAVVQELRGEKIDIVTWDPDPAKFICNALAPAEITRVIVDEENQRMEVVVPDDQLSLAIGKRGQNVRLASKLSGWNLDVTSESSYNQALKDAYDSLLNLNGIGEKTALNLYQAGFRSAKDVAESSIEDLSQVKDIGEEKAKKLIQNAQLYLETQTEEGEAEPEGVKEDVKEAGEDVALGER
ncbi:MAG: transcription termination/antitermination protein NusA [Deltaproteobacteria bacterium]|nr:transcription termination/antitermination protein NusA [Deltaproteobacteria bacterium]MBW2137103.1 transcription termination/antitermination protein NusA [Deltaproteobacteria bacterium]